MRLGPLDQPRLERWGRAWGRALRGPAWIGLRGPLGAGKSVLARAIAAGMGVEARMPSPTYNLVLRYPGSEGRVLVHMDLYRLSRAEELDELGWDELPGPDEVVVVEWPERAGPRWPPMATEVELVPVSGAPDLRMVVVAGSAPGEVPHA
ncbi:MAG: tRNA (adenosine(37)-N6)-threonylcarbamoyltransferase complex ATPase subunit type 1 TsaE [Gemmatimonadota bacterium]